MYSPFVQNSQMNFDSSFLVIYILRNFEQIVNALTGRGPENGNVSQDMNKIFVWITEQKHLYSLSQIDKADICLYTYLFL